MHFHILENAASLNGGGFRKSSMLAMEERVSAKLAPASFKLGGTTSDLGEV